jgi:hypothetical protein
MVFKTYIGSPVPQDSSAQAVVLVNDGQKSWPLPLRVDLFDHSPSGFSWGLFSAPT